MSRFAWGHTSIAAAARDEGTPIARYHAACARERTFAEATAAFVDEAAARGAVQQARRRCVAAAAFVIQGTPMGDDPSDPALDPSKLGPIDENSIRAFADNQPECAGYDVADPQVCYADAQWWLQTYGRTNSNVVIIGIRTGGSHLAPMWALACEQATRGCGYRTARPQRRADGTPHYTDGPDTELDNPSDVVLVDDAVCSGATTLALASHLRARYPAARYWVATPGQVYATDENRLVSVRSSSPLLEPGSPGDPRKLWELLLPSDRDELRAVLRGGLEHEIGTNEPFEIQLHVRGFAARYESDRVWLPWNHPSLRNEPRRRINPRKSNFFVRSRSGQTLAHARFVGTGVFGRAQWNRIQRFTQIGPRPLALVDGFALTEHVPGLQEFSTCYHSADRILRAQLRRSVGVFFRTLAATSTIPSALPSGTYPVAVEARHVLTVLCQRLGFDLSSRREALLSHLPNDLHFVGPTGLLVQSSLSHSLGPWHWGVAEGHLVRFHVDTLWSCVGSIEREIAAFAISQQLPLPDLDALLEELSDLAPYQLLRQGVRNHVGAAVLLLLRSWKSGLKRPRPDIESVLDRELAQITTYVKALETYLED